MIKRTLYFGNPSYLSLRNEQLVVEFPNDQGYSSRFGSNSIPVEDVGLVVLDSRQITISHGLLNALLSNKSIVVCCDSTHHPAGMLYSLDAHTEQTRRLSAQVESSLPLRKNMWQQVVSQKIENQAEMLRRVGADSAPMLRWSKEVRSGDPANLEGRAAAYYWPLVFPEVPGFLRSREGESPNAWLNYGYAILRATMARAIVGAGLHPALGVHHRNKYNSFCLADDLMEPYRPMADLAVSLLLHRYGPGNELSKEVKQALLSLPSQDVRIRNERSPIMVAMEKTAVSLVKCYLGESRNLYLPEFENQSPIC